MKKKVLKSNSLISLKKVEEELKKSGRVLESLVV
jgi:hypothetical protein